MCESVYESPILTVREGPNRSKLGHLPGICNSELIPCNCRILNGLALV